MSDRGSGTEPTLDALRARLARTPGMVHGGRLIAFDDPDRVGWREVARQAHEEGRVGLLMFPRDRIDEVRHRLGDDWHVHRWTVLVGARGDVLPICRRIVGGTALPPNGSLRVLEGEDDAATRQEVARLDEACGVTPQPPWYARGELVPSLTTLLHDEHGRLVGTGAAQARHHPDGTYAGWIFVGSVAVDPEQRGRGLGRLVNAFTVAEALARLPGDHVYEHVAPDNAPSQAMVRGCGLHEDPDRVALVASREATAFTR